MGQDTTMSTTENVVGIDLGTTNSLIGTVYEGAAILFRDQNQLELLPSVVGVDAKGSIIVGRTARNRRWLDPEGTVVSVKRLMGTETSVRVGTKPLSPSQVSALILGALLDRAESQLGTRPARAIITVPAYFDDRQREATRLAGEFAGIAVERLVNEPTSAAMCYQTGGEANVLVYDFGGGTFDVSVLERDEGFLEVKSSHGDTHLGGDDIDQALFQLIVERLGKDASRVESDPAAKARLTDAVERAKIALSLRDEVRLSEPFLAGSGDDAVHLDQVLTVEDLEQVVGPLVQRTLVCIDAALRDARLVPQDLDRVILVGGSSRIPLVGRRVSEHLNRPVLMDDRVDTAVALGAAMLAGRAAGQVVADVLVDITPHTLACGVLDEENPPSDESGLFAAPVIPRNTVVPVERSCTFFTTHENQAMVDIPISQGEASTIGENTWLGLVRVEGLPPSPAHSPVEVSLRLDLSGVLTARATHVPSGRDATVVFANSPYHLTAQRRSAQRREVEALRARPSAELPAARAVSDAERKLAEALLSRARRSLSQPDLLEPAAKQKVEDAAARLLQALAGDGADVAALVDDVSDALLDLA
jgi:molecular chaperone DnaK